MKLTEVITRDVKKIKLVHLKVDPTNSSVIVVSGENGAGKSSFIDSITMTLSGMKDASPEPVRRGAKKGSTTIKFDTGLVVKRTFQASGGSLLTVSRDGVRCSSPQEVIDEFFGRLAFDPHAFSRMKPAEQLKTMKTLAGLDFTMADDFRANLFSERTEYNKEIKRMEARIATMPFHPDAPATEHSSAELLSELNRRTTVNSDIQKIRDNLKRMDDSRIEAERLMNEKSISIQRVGNAANASIETLDSELEVEIARLRANCERKKVSVLQKRDLDIQELQVALERAITQKNNAEYHIEQSREASSSAVELDLSEVQQQLALADVVNKKVGDNARRDELLEELEELVAKSDAHTKQINDIDEQKRETIKAANFPVPGLSLDDNSVTLNGFAFSEASESEQLRASILIGKATNPKMQLMFVREGGAFTDKGMLLLAQIAEENDLQLLVERPGDGGKMGITIEDGMVVGAADEVLEEVMA